MFDWSGVGCRVVNPARLNFLRSNPPWKSSLSFSLDNLLPTTAKRNKQSNDYPEKVSLITKGKEIKTTISLKLISKNTTTIQNCYKRSQFTVETKQSILT